MHTARPEFIIHAHTHLPQTNGLEKKPISETDDLRVTELAFCAIDDSTVSDVQSVPVTESSTLKDALKAFESYVFEKVCTCPLLSVTRM